MPDVQANRRQWDADYSWTEAGDEWSAAWGGPSAQWHFSLRPRLAAFLPAGSILEIAPGHGRWSEYLIECCDAYVGVDLSARAVAACRKRFAGAEHADFHVNDGRSLDAVSDASIDLAFSFDSLVHVEDDVIAAYLGELERVLTADGVAFIHHSNLAACKPVARPYKTALKIAERVRDRNTGGFDQWRGTSMSAERLEELAAAAGMRCIGQELVNWLGSRLIDCISLVTPVGSRWERPNTAVANPYFMAEAAAAARAAAVYGRSSVTTADPGDVVHRLGAIAGVGSKTLGPWAVSVIGPWPKRSSRAH